MNFKQLSKYDQETLRKYQEYLYDAKMKFISYNPINGHIYDLDYIHRMNQHHSFLVDLISKYGFKSERTL